MYCVTNLMDNIAERERKVNGLGLTFAALKKWLNINIC